MSYQNVFFKTIIDISSFLFLISVAFMGVASAQDVIWTEQTAPFATGFLSDVSFVDELNGWAVGFDQGTNLPAIIYSSDGGNQWILQENNLTGMLNAIHFLDANIGLAVGQDWTNGTAAILKTDDGGQQWQNLDVSSINGMGALENVIFITAAEGWAVGQSIPDNQSLIVHTDDGITWTETDHPAHTGRLIAVDFSDAQNGWIVGTDEAENTPLILNTTDGGTTWNEQIHPVVNGEFYGVSFVNANEGAVTGHDGTITIVIETEDGGTTWNPCIISKPTNYQAVSANLVDNKGRDIELIKANLGLALKYDFGLEKSFVIKAGYEGMDWTNHDDEFDAFGSRFDISNDRIHIVGDRPGSEPDDPHVPFIVTGDLPSDVEDALDRFVPLRYSLCQNYPNPFNPETIIQFTITQIENVLLKVYDTTGREIATLLDQKLNPGVHQIPFNAHGLSSSVYFYKIQTTNYQEVKKMVLMQ